MYLRDCVIEGVGPIERLDLTLPLGDHGVPKPLVLVGKNGSGKTILLAHIVDALIEFAKPTFYDVVAGQEGLRFPYFKVLGGLNQRSGAKYGIALLKFEADSGPYCYIDKSGVLEATGFWATEDNRFPSVSAWPADGNYKLSNIAEDYAREFFTRATVCFFPSTRHEAPHWLNQASIGDEPLFYPGQRYTDRLDKPIVVESSASENRQWLMDVMLDSRADLQVVETPSAEPQLSLDCTVQEYMLLRQARTNAEAVLKAVLQDASAQLQLFYRSTSSHRLGVKLSSGLIIPSLNHLSSGQANLLNLFWTLIRYADRADINKSIRPEIIEGIVVIDEVEAQIHAELQYELLPKLIMMFPKIQFILTSHSPLFLLGMERLFGSDGFRIIEMPTGQTITTERFSEFARSWDYYRQTTAYELEMERALASSTKPMVLTEGETDRDYIKTALELLQRQDLLDALDIQWVGEPGSRGPSNAGSKGLDNTVKVLSANPSLSNRHALFLYDSDTQKECRNSGRIHIRTLPVNSENTRARRGIENLFPESLFIGGFYTKRIKHGEYGEETVIEEFNKAEFCRWICVERRNEEDFRHFEPVVGILEDFLRSCDTYLVDKSSI